MKTLDKKNGIERTAYLNVQGDDWVINVGTESLFIGRLVAEGWARCILGLPEDFMLSDTAKAATAVSKAQGGQT